MDKYSEPSNEDDYSVVRSLIQFISKNWREQPTIDELAEHARLQPRQLHQLFFRWAGITPMGFVQALTIDHARHLLRDRASVLDASYEVGLSGPSRLHDLFVTHEAMSPGSFKTRGAGLTIGYGYHPSPFGVALVMVTPRGLAGLAFVQDDDREKTFVDMARRWPAAEFEEDPGATHGFVGRIFEPGKWNPDQPLQITFIGTDFEIRVWETLLSIPFGKATTYGDIAAHLNVPKAARAVGTAVGKNPISFVVPCHRVLAKDCSLGGYHWGLTRKRAILGWEAGLG